MNAQFPHLGVLKDMVHNKYMYRDIPRLIKANYSCVLSALHIGI